MASKDKVSSNEAKKGEEKEGWLRSGTGKPVVLGPEAQAMKTLGESLGLEGADLVQLISQGAKRDFDLKLEKERREEEQRFERERRDEERRQEKEREEKREEERRIERQLKEEEIRLERDKWQRLFERDEKRWELDREERAKERERLKDPSTSSFKVKIDPLTDKDDVDLYLRYYERIAATHGWSDEVMALRLLPLLQGTAREAVMQMPPEEIREYHKMRETLLCRFKKTAEHFRRKFRDVRKETGESFVQCGKRMKSYVERWFAMLHKDLDNVDDVLDVFLQEAVFKLLHPEMEIRVREQRPSSYTAILELADNFAEARSAARPSRSHRQEGKNDEDGESKLNGDDKDRDTAKPKFYKNGSFNHKQGDNSETRVKVKAVKVKEQETNDPTSARYLSRNGGVSKCNDYRADSFCPTMGAYVNESAVVALRDTSADTILVDSRLVRASDRTRRTVTVCSVDPGWEKEAEIAIIDVHSPWLQGRVEAVVLERSTQDLIVGNCAKFSDGKKSRVPLLPVCPVRIKESSAICATNKTEILAVETRSQANKQRNETPLNVKPVPGVDVTPEKLK